MNLQEKRNYVLENLHFVPEEEKKLFLRYVQLRETRKNQEIKDAYHRGFKTEIQFLLETLEK